MADSALHCAVGLLSRREHSQLELKNKLRLRAYPDSEINAALDRLVEQGLQNDERFAESFINLRMGRGSGPLKIRAELLTRGVDEGVVALHLSASDAHWCDKARQVAEKKYGIAPPQDAREKARRIRFMSSRGFSWDHCRHLW